MELNTSYPTFHTLILSDFNAANLAGYLNNNNMGKSLTLEAECAPFGQVKQLLLDPQAPSRKKACDLLVIWTSPEGIIDSYRIALAYESIAMETIIEEVDEFADLVLNSAEWAGCVMLSTWTLPVYHRGLGMLDWRPGIGLAVRLAQMNLRLAERIADHPKIFILDANRWMLKAGRFSFNAKLWHMGKIPFNHEVFKAAALDIFSAFSGFKGMARKLLVLDLDNTLWGGIVGDDGWENLKLGGHDPVGEAFVDFQRELKALSRRGIILGIVSKNDEKVALNAIEKHPEMILKEIDFAGWKINWHDKAANVVELSNELNLGLQSIVFIDDNPMERARVKEALPEVLVPDWPEDCLLYRKALNELSCFDIPSIVIEDQHRVEMYSAERQRRTLKEEVGSLQDWLKSLDMQISVMPIQEENLGRIAQLLNKTNQMNLSTRRMSETELKVWADLHENSLWTLRVSDRFGDAGLTGLVGLHQEEDKLHIVDFVLSCRVFGRQVEDLMLQIAVSEAHRRKCKTVFANFIPTAKNKPTLDFLERSGMDRVSDTLFLWPIERACRIPEHLNVTGLMSS